MWWRAILVMMLAAVVVADPAAAHVRSTTGYSVIRSDSGSGGATVSYQLSLEYEFLARAAGLGPGAVAATGDGPRQRALDSGRDALTAYLQPRVEVFLDDVACEMSLGPAGIEQRQDIGYARLTLSYECPGSPTGSYRVEYAVFAPSDGVVDDHANLVDYALGGERGQVVLDGGNPGFVAGERSLWSSLSRFVALGFEHILGGADHVLFVVALLLGARSFGSVAKVVSMFTLAHSVTLALAVLGWVNLPAGIVEPLIALSIAYVAAENLLGRDGGDSRHRLAVVFGFGLLHGLGFAGSLQFNDEVSWGLAGSLAGFNLGIELGQGLLVLLIFPVLALTRRFRWSVPVRLGAAGIVAIFGLFWFVERMVLS
jgi:HupE / UreJ protein